MADAKVLVLVLHAESGAYAAMGAAQKRLWMADGPLECIQYVGGGHGAPVLEDAHTLRIDAREGDKWKVGPKTVDAFRWAAENREFDFVFRTNTSSYVDQQMLLAHAQTLPRLRHCSGRIDARYGDFASGSGYTLSRDLAESLVASGFMLDDAPDDVSLSRWLAKNAGVKAVDAPRIDLQLPAQLAEWRAAGSPASFHYRCRSLRTPRPAWELGCFDEINRTIKSGKAAQLSGFKQVIA